MQILLTTKDTREGAALPLRTICYRHLSTAPHTNSPIKDEIHGARGRPYLAQRHAEEKARIGGKRLRGRMITFAGADDNVCRGG